MKIVKMPEPDIEIYLVVDFRTWAVKANTDEGLDCIDAYTKQPYRVYRKIDHSRKEFAAFPMTENNGAEMLSNSVSDGLLIVRQDGMVAEVNGQ